MKKVTKDKKVKPSKTIDDVFNENIKLEDGTFKGWQEGEFEKVMEWLLKKPRKTIF